MGFKRFKGRPIVFNGYSKVFQRIAGDFMGVPVGFRSIPEVFKEFQGSST